LLKGQKIARDYAKKAAKASKSLLKEASNSPNGGILQRVFGAD
jgi:hypothetical protein